MARSMLATSMLRNPYSQRDALASQNAATQTSSSGVSAAARRRVSNLYATAKRIYAPGGEYMAGTEAGLKRGQQLSVASGMQNLAASGMAGTSMAGNLGQMYEENVGAPTRARATTERLGALAGILQSEAGATANLATRYSTSPMAYRGGGGGGGGGYAPRTSSARRTTTTAPAARRIPTLSAFPSLTGGARSRSRGTSVQPMLVSRGDPLNVNRPAGTFSYYDV